MKNKKILIVSHQFLPFVSPRTTRWNLLIDELIKRGNEVTVLSGTNPENMEKYYEIAKLLNEERMKHWRIIRSIANENQERKLDSIWSKAKEKITSTN